jgi:CheY-like chemotaxis protein
MKILVVDDENLDRTLLERLVSKHGHEVMTASGGKEAIEKYKAGDISLVLMDWMMPGMDGIQACKEIRLIDREKKEDYLEAMAAGVDEFLQKPVDEQTLWARIRTGERILTSMHDFERKNEELKGLWNQLIIHNVGLKDHIKTLKEKMDKPSDVKAPRATALKSSLETGEAYLIECPHGDDGAAYRLFKSETDMGFPGLVLSRTHPDKIRKAHGLTAVEIVWLSKGFARGSSNSCLPLNIMMTHPDAASGLANEENLAAVMEVVREFLDKRENGIVLFSGIEYLFARFAQNSVLEMIYGLSELVKGGASRIIVTCNPEALEPRLVALLKQEMVWMPAKA